MSIEQFLDRGTDSEVVRAGILDAAADAFFRNGYSLTTIDDIADGIGATKGAITIIIDRSSTYISGCTSTG